MSPLTSMSRPTRRISAIIEDNPGAAGVAFPVLLHENANELRVPCPRWRGHVGKADLIFLFVFLHVQVQLVQEAVYDRGHENAGDHQKQYP